ncbi:MAG TPA: hypothetical protein VM165_23525, partial [Planctomycetaceae bacterium]|nr:hypothetical protein [Planctomycetaceae bacterium]
MNITMRNLQFSLTLFVLAIWICGCQNSHEQQLAEARAEAEAARTELARVQAAAQAAPSKVKVSGELFATTKGGDVKKGAGVKVYLIPITAAERDLVADTLGRSNALEAASERFRQGLDRKYPRR